MTERFRCSFCGKHQNEVKKLLAGANALICNECVAVAKSVMKQAPQDSDKPAPWPAPLKPPRR